MYLTMITSEQQSSKFLSLGDFNPENEEFSEILLTVSDLEYLENKEFL